MLHLGVGTGPLSAIVVEAFPCSRITLVNISGEILDEARRRFVDEPNDRFCFRVMDYAKEPLGEEYELVASALSIHHLEEEEKRGLFERTYGVLRDVRAFINADQAPEDAGEERRNGGTWPHWVLERGEAISPPLLCG